MLPYIETILLQLNLQTENNLPLPKHQKSLRTASFQSKPDKI